MKAPVVEPLGENALLLRLGGRIEPALNRRVHALAAALDAQRPPWLLDIVPAYASLALFFDMQALAAGDPATETGDPLQRAETWLRAQALDPAVDDATVTGEPLEIPVRYGGKCGPDLQALADHAGMSVADVVDCHAGADYRVAMLGFAPGFPYLLGLEPRLAMPRRATPRTRIPAGSVAIGGAQTGIYPREGPGGWHVVGRTPLALFDPARVAPSLLVPGQRVRFVAIDDDAFERLAAPT